MSGKPVKSSGEEPLIPAVCWPKNLHKAAVEKAWLEYTAIWGGVMGVVMITGLGSVWTDIPLMVLGLSIGLGTYAWPLLRGLPKGAAGTLNAMFAGITVLAFTMHYIATPFFFDVLHMRYGFDVEWRIDRNPIFLYPLTIAYFATYCVMGCMFYRWALQQYPAISPMVVNLVVSMALAFLETVLNANPFIADLFCYDDNFFALTFGTFSYGVGFMFSLPVWLYAVPDGPTTMPNAKMLQRSVSGNFVAELAHGVFLWYNRHNMAPIVTTVIDNSPPQGGCLGDRRTGMW